MVKRTIGNVKKAFFVGSSSLSPQEATVAKAASSDKTIARIAMRVSGADPSETGKGGESILGKPFKDDANSKLLHYGRGVVSTAKISRRYKYVLPSNFTPTFFIEQFGHEKLPYSSNSIKVLDKDLTVFGFFIALGRRTQDISICK
ncbi:hypothetical protein L1987_09150 [Smallanthus sonchifolius]|uniref:Uncharacterized protein n=1 Tax=Smallanthus sonchifolius TaxID=185202 RepID=A0ACB9JN67_9ASTR|nr:hypothetical protein L1987_09150 [Smallanthus sonchifolius]